MEYRKKERIAAVVLLVVFLGAVLAHYRWGSWSFYRAVPEEEAALRLCVVAQAEGWLGTSEADGSHEAIIDLYNTVEPLPMGYVVQYSDSWCAAFVSAVSLQTGLTEILPPECSCGRQIELLSAMGCWEENDEAIPQPGDLIYYDWDQQDPGESLGWPDHVGIVVGCKWPFLKVIEGNKDDAVTYRYLPVGHKSIRGYGFLDY
jgi:hypothetical protein